MSHHAEPHSKALGPVKRQKGCSRTHGSESLLWLSQEKNQDRAGKLNKVGLDNLNNFHLS